MGILVAWMIVGSFFAALRPKGTFWFIKFWWDCLVWPIYLFIPPKKS